MIRRKMCFNRSVVVFLGYAGFILLLLLVLNTLYPQKNIVPKELRCPLQSACTQKQLSASFWFKASHCSARCEEDAKLAGDKNPANQYKSCFDGEHTRCLVSTVDPEFPPYNTILKSPILSSGYTVSSKLSPCSLFGDLLPEKPDYVYPYFDMKNKRILDFSTCTKHFQFPKFACTSVNRETNSIDIQCYKKLRWGGLSNLVFDYQFDKEILHANMTYCDDVESVLGSSLPYVPCKKDSSLICRSESGIKCYSTPTK